MVLEKILHRLTIRGKLRNAHIINKSSIVHRPSSIVHRTSYIVHRTSYIVHNQWFMLCHSPISACCDRVVMGTDVEGDERDKPCVDAKMRDNGADAE